MWMRFTVLLLIIIAGTAMAAAPVSQPKITIDVRDADIVSVLGLIFRQAGANYSLMNDVKGTVTAHIDGRTLDEALRSVLSPRGYTWRKADGTYTVGKKREQVESTQPPANPAAVQPPVGTVDTSDEVPKTVEKTTLNFMDAYDLKAMIEGGGRTFDQARNGYAPGQWGNQGNQWGNQGNQWGQQNNPYGNNGNSGNGWSLHRRSGQSYGGPLYGRGR
jgi:hypothetical protein